ncbi:Hypothetical predicted protein, partial [Mytilus galloprovincialis]
MTSYSKGTSTCRLDSSGGCCIEAESLEGWQLIQRNSFGLENVVSEGRPTPANRWWCNRHENLSKVTEQPGLGSKGVTIYWIGQPGLQIEDLDSLLDAKRKFLPSPHFIIIHCGANDLTDLELTGKGLMENARPKTVSTPSKKVTVQDIHDLQYRALQGQLEIQEMQKIQMDLEKTNWNFKLSR